MCLDTVVKILRLLTVTSLTGFPLHRRRQRWLRLLAIDHLLFPRDPSSQPGAMDFSCLSSTSAQNRYCWPHANLYSRLAFVVRIVPDPEWAFARRATCCFLGSRDVPGCDRWLRGHVLW